MNSAPQKVIPWMIPIIVFIPASPGGQQPNECLTSTSRLYRLRSGCEEVGLAETESSTWPGAEVYTQSPPKSCN